MEVNGIIFEEDEQGNSRMSRYSENYVEKVKNESFQGRRTDNLLKLFNCILVNSSSTEYDNLDITIEGLLRPEYKHQHPSNVLTLIEWKGDERLLWQGYFAYAKPRFYDSHTIQNRKPLFLPLQLPYLSLH